MNEHGISNLDDVILGEWYKSKVHDIKGIATAKVEWLTSIPQVMLEWTEGGNILAFHFDVTCLEAVDKSTLTPNEQARVLNKSISQMNKR